jgi:hypothetical protein
MGEAPGGIGEAGAGSVQETAEGALGVEQPSTEAAPAESSAPEDLPGYDPKESAAQTLERIIKEQDGKGEEKPEGEPERPNDPAIPPAEKITAPQRLSARAKEAWDKADPVLKTEYARMFADQERAFHKAQREWSQKISEAGDLHEATKPFETEWYQAGYSRAAAVRQLAATHRKLVSDDPKTFADEFIRIGNDRGVNWEALAAYATGRTKQAEGGQRSQSDNAEIQALRQEVQRLQSYHRQAEEQASMRENESIASEFRKVYDEKDASGRYLYPELHDESFDDRAAPLIAGIRAATPELSYSDAVRRAIWVMRGNVGNPPAPNPIRPSAQAIKPPISPISVRGKSAPAVSTNGELADIPADVLARGGAATMEWVLRNARG